MEDKQPDAAGAVGQTLHQLHVQFELVQHENQDLKETLAVNKRNRTKNKVRSLVPDDLNQQGFATFWSPRSKARADQRQAAIEQQQLEEEAAKTTRRELKHQNKLLKAKEKEDNRVRRLRLKEERDHRVAESRARIDACKAAREAQNSDRDAQNSIQLSKQANVKASHRSQSKITKRRGGGAARSRVVANSPPAPYGHLGIRF